MRKTAREEYTEQLEDALAELRAIRDRFQRAGDLTATRDDLNRWKDSTATGIEKYGGRDDSKSFRTHVDFNVLGLSGIFVSDGIAKYDDLLVNVLRKLPSIDVQGGYADDVRVPLEQIDELLERLIDLFRRSMKTGELDYQTADEGLRRWRDHAYKVLTDLVGEDEAGEIYSMKPAGATWGDPDGSIEEQYEMYMKYLHNLKEDIQKYPHHLIAPTGATSVPVAAGNAAAYVHATRLRELKAIKSSQFDLSRLIALCEELNLTWRGGAHHATGMLVRAIMDHVPPIFGVSSFTEVASNYSGSRSFREAMAGLDSAARKIGDAHLHTQIRKSESLPTSTQVNFSQQLDLLLGEIGRILK